MNIESGWICDRGLSTRRPVNEDRALVLPDAGLFVVCDGVGGHSGGEVASQLAVDTIEEALRAGVGAATDVVRAAVEYANRDIVEMAARHPEYKGMATTIALLLLDPAGRAALIGHAGDSRVYRFTAGELVRETVDHTDAGGNGHTNTINRALGIDDVADIDYKSIQVRNGDAFLLCSDGVTRHVEDSELAGLFAECVEPATICARIKDACYQRGAEDNLTAVVVQVGERVVAQAVPGVRPAPAEVRPRRPSAGAVGLIAIIAAAAGFSLGVWSQSAPPIPSRAELARRALDAGDLETARAIYSALVTEEPARADDFYGLGRTALRQGDVDLAVASLQRCVALDAGHGDAYLYLAAAYRRQDQPELARQALERWAALTGSTTDSKDLKGEAITEGTEDKRLPVASRPRPRRLRLSPPGLFIPVCSLHFVAALIAS
jgi:protein phosphatase